MMPERALGATRAGAPRAARLTGLIRALAGRPRPGPARRLVALVLRVGGAALLAWIGYVHWLLWHEGYRLIATDGPFFLVDAIAAGVLAVVLLAWPRAIVGLAAAAFTLGTILALVISLTVGLFGFTESISAPHVVQALVLESVAVVVLVAWSLLAAWSVPGRARRRGR